jgi:O-antigen/teichoic acid export membrane protein
MSTRAALVWSFAERYASFAIGLASTLVLARLLTPAEVGVFSLCMALMALLGILRDFGISEYLIQERELTRERIASATGLALAIAWPVAAAVFLLRGVIAGFFGEPRVADVLTVLCLQLALVPLTSPVFALLHRALEFRRLFVLQLSCNAAAAAVTVLLAWRGFGSLALAAGPLVVVVVQTALLLAWRATRAMFVAPRAAGWRHVLRFGVPYSGSRALETLAKNVHEPVIARQFDFASVGLFSRALGLVEMFHGHVADAVVRVVTPAFAEAHRRGEAIAAGLQRAISMYVAVAWPFFAFIAIAAPEIVRVLFGPQWVAAAPLATVLALAAIPAGLCELVPQVLSATGAVGHRLRVAAWTMPVHVAAVVAASFVSLQAVALAFCLSAVWNLTLSLTAARKALGVGLCMLRGAVVGAGTIALASAAGMGLVAALARSTQVPAWATLPAVAAAGALGWWLAAAAVRHPAHALAREMLRDRLKSRLGR